MANNCTQITAECTIEGTTYGYYPSLAANGFFLGFFVFFGILNLGFGLMFKTWSYATAMALACVTEAVGYVGRVMLNNNPYSSAAFTMQITCIIIGPAFNSAAIYLTLKYLVLTFGAEWSRVKPQSYLYIFIGGDILSLILQGAGGGLAAGADAGSKTLKVGDNFAMAGIAWQVFTLSVFALAVVDYVFRRRQSSVPLPASAARQLRQYDFRLFAGAMVIAWLTIFIRCIYRIVEFAAGWSNPIMRNQTNFIVLEGSMIAIAVFFQTVPHPGYCFPILSKGQKITIISEPKILDSTDVSREDVNYAYPPPRPRRDV